MSAPGTITKLTGNGSSGAAISMTDSGDHQNFTLAQAPTTANYVIVINGGTYQTDDDDFPFSVSGTTLTFISPLSAALAAKKKKLLCL